MKRALIRESGLLHRLENITSTSSPILSVYLNLLPGSNETRSIGARLRDHLKPITVLAESDTLDRSAATSLRRGIDRVLELGPTLDAHLGSGWAIFVCDQLELEEQLVVPPRVWDTAIAGFRPYLRPLRAALGESRRIATIVLDARHADITISEMGEILDRKAIKAEVVRVANRGGWHGLDEHRNRQHAEEVRHQLWRETSESISTFHRADGIDVIFIGGQDKAVEGLSGFLPPAIRSLIGETFNVDIHTLTEPKLMQAVRSLEETYERQEETRMVADMYAANAVGDEAAVGLDRVIRAANQHAISELAIQHGATADGRLCVGCGALTRLDPVCTECGTETSLVIDVLDEIAHLVISAGGLVEDVVAETALSDDIVAAMLRFPIR